MFTTLNVIISYYVICIICQYIFLAFFFQEALLSIVAAALLIGVGIITLDSYDHPDMGSPAGKALAGLSISAGGLFIINLFFVLLALREHR